MPIAKITDISTTNGPLLGIDPGKKTLGVAISDRYNFLSTSLITVKRKKFQLDAAEIFKIYNERQCKGIIMGHPINMDGTSGQRAQSVRALSKNLLTVQDVPLILWDERMSTQAVERDLIQQLDMSRAKRSAIIDAHAAQFILQGALDALQNLRANTEIK